jgi:hypothetical protein
MFRPNLFTVRLRPILGLLALVGSLIASTAQAQANFGAFTLKITEKEMNLEHPTDMDWQKYLMWDLPVERMNDRNMPYLELSNNAESNAPITEFRLTIGDTRFNFSDKNMGMFAMAASTTKNIDITSSTRDDLGDELILKIGDGGLQPGDMFRFRIDLDVDEEFADVLFAHPDYRTVLFDMNGLNVYDGFLQQISSTDNGMASAIYDPAVGPNFTTGPIALADELVIGPAADFYNNNYRRYRDMDPVRTFLIGGDTTAIPEPATAILAAVGAAGVLVSLSRSRRTARTA